MSMDDKAIEKMVNNCVNDSFHSLVEEVDKAYDQKHNAYLAWTRSHLNRLVSKTFLVVSLIYGILVGAFALLHHILTQI